MANCLYLSAAEPDSGKVVVALGLMGILERTISRVGFFRPIGVAYKPTTAERTVADRDVHLMREVFRLDADPIEMVGVPAHEAETMIAEGRNEELYERVLSQFKRLQEKADFVLCEGSDFISIASIVEDDFNSNMARHLNAPVLLVVDGSSNDPDTIYNKAKVGLECFHAKGCEVLAVVINRVDPCSMGQVNGNVAGRLRDAGVAIVAQIPNEPALGMPRMDEVAAHLNGEVLFGLPHLHNKVGKVIVISGSVDTIIPLLDNNVVLVSHHDRHDVIFLALVSLASTNAPNIAGIVLTGQGDLSPQMLHLLNGLPGPRIPIVRSSRPTYETVLDIGKVKPGIEPTQLREIEVARQLFESSVDTQALARAIRLSETHLMTPAMFKFELLRRARSQKKRVVLPEGHDERILRAADALLRLKACNLTILGKPDDVLNRAGQLSLDLTGAQIIDPQDNEYLEEFTSVYHKERQHKGVTPEMARDAVVEPPVFGTLMVHTGRADGMVAGATHSTAVTIRPALQLVKTRRGISLVSSVFFMCLEDRVLVYGDCAVNPDPTAAELAEIALASAETAQAFGIEPIVAMLSYSTGESGSGADVDKVKEAVRIARERRPDLKLEGPLQYDAAVDASVGKAKLPGSAVAGNATVFIFPDLNTGNNTYKAVQRSAHAVAVGPVLQGLNKPVNDLSRGCLVEDIVNTVAITAIQSQFS
jgi:phosphate acetyltransferase